MWDAEEAQAEIVVRVSIESCKAADDLEVAERLLCIAPANLAARVLPVRFLPCAAASLNDVLASRAGYVALLMFMSAEVEVDAAVFYCSTQEAHVRQLTVPVIAKRAFARCEDRMVANQDFETGVMPEGFGDRVELSRHKRFREYSLLRYALTKAENIGVHDVNGDPWRQFGDLVARSRHAPRRRLPSVRDHGRRVAAENIQQIFVADALKKLNAKALVVRIEALGENGGFRIRADVALII
jgi:hypothetical protein